MSTSLWVQAEAAVVRTSTLDWIVETMGGFSLGLLLLTGLAIFVGACLVIRSAPRPATIAAYVIVLPLPVLMGTFVALQEQLSSLTALAYSDQALTSAQIAGGIAAGLLPLHIGLAVTLPSYGVLAAGLLFRTFRPWTSAPLKVEPPPAVPSKLRGAMSVA